MAEYAQSRGVRRPKQGPAILDRGFRLFFFAAALWAILLMALFVAGLGGMLVVDPALGLIDWHAHELLFGYTGAVIAGFLLTAVPNWTKRYPVSGWRLVVLFTLWLAGRLAMAFSAPLGPLLAVCAELAFPVGLAAVIAREVIAAKNYRNLRVLVLVALFALCDAGFLYEGLVLGVSDYARRGALSVVLMLIMLIGGRVVPSFTRNWLAQRRVDNLPIAFNRTDTAIMAVSGAALALWTIWPDLAPALLILAGLANLVRLARWKGWQTAAEPLVLVLHAGFLFVPLGMLAVGLSGLWPALVPPTGALHLMTAGAVGLMTLAMMTRVSLGHTGGILHADGWIAAIYVSLVGAVVLRLAYAYSYATGLLDAAATLWILAFALFLWRYRYMATTLNDPRSLDLT